MIEQFYRATDNNGSCWDFNCEPKWVEDHWRPANHEYREYTGPNKPSPGKCEKRISVAAVCGLSDFGSLEHKLLEKEHQLTAKEQQIVSLKVTLNDVTARAADLESGKRGEVNRLASLKVRLDKAQALVSGLESQVKQLKQHRESDTKDFLDQQTRLHESEKRVAELEKQSKVMPKPVEEVYLRIKNT